MKELSLHIMDMAENGIEAGADLISIEVDERIKENIMRIEVTDNGRGIDPSMLETVDDPFVTTRKTRRVGMGISLFKAAAERCAGSLAISSTPGEGTSVVALFAHDHIDRAPLGDMTSSLVTLLAGYPHVDFRYTQRVEEREFVFETREVREVLGEVPLHEPSVLLRLKEMIDSETIKLRDIDPDVA